MNKTFKKILSVCCTVVTTLTSTLFHSTDVRAETKYKIVFIGEEGVGKTQLIRRIDGKEFSDQYSRTIGIDLNYPRDIFDKVEIWDTAGEEKFLYMLPVAYKCCDLLMFCCSCTHLKTQVTPDLGKYPGIQAGIKMLFCITQDDDQIITNEMAHQALNNFREANQNYNILPVVLVTSAKNNAYKLCTPDPDQSSEDHKYINSDLKGELVNLCRKTETAPEQTKDTTNDKEVKEINLTTEESISTTASDEIYSTACYQPSEEETTYDPEYCEQRQNQKTSATEISNSDHDVLQSDRQDSRNELFETMKYVSLVFGLIGLLGAIDYYDYDRHKKKKLVTTNSQNYTEKNTEKMTC